MDYHALFLCLGGVFFVPDRLLQDSIAERKELGYQASIARGERPIDFSDSVELKHLDVIPARELIDRDAIEEKAIQLIDGFRSESKALRPLEAEANARTAIFEALTASGHMSRVELPGRQDEVHGQVVTRLLNGFYRTGIPDHERARVFQEICEELTIYEAYLQIISGYLPPETKITTISDYADPLGSDANRLGYRSQNKKGMIRETSFDLGEDGNFTRVIKQISRSNSDAATSILVLQESGVAVRRRAEADVDLLGSQLIGAKVGALEIMKRLDNSAGLAVMYGEHKRSSSISYEQLESESVEREKRVELFINELASTERSLDQMFSRGEIDQAVWNRRYGEKLRRIIQSICVVEPRYVRDALGDRVIHDYERAHQAYLSGDTVSADAIVSGVSHLESAIVVCGMEVSNNVASDETDTSNSDIQKMLERSKWEWKNGYCRESLCEFNKKMTKVGPCDVCICCQGIYDDGKNPSDVYRRQQEISALETAFNLSLPVAESKQAMTSNNELVEIETIVFVGGATKIYQNRITGMKGTKQELVGAN